MEIKHLEKMLKLHKQTVGRDIMAKFESLKLKSIEESHETQMADRELMMINERPIDKANCYKDVSNVNINLSIFNYMHSQRKKEVMHKLANNEEEWHPDNKKFYKIYKAELANKIMGTKENDIIETKKEM